MIAKKSLKMNLRGAVFGFFFAILSIITGVASPILSSVEVYAKPGAEEQVEGSTDDATARDEQNGGQTEGQTGEQTEEQSEAGRQNEESNNNKPKNSDTFDDACHTNFEKIGWIVCPVTKATSDAVDWLYERIQGILEIKPIAAEAGSPIYEIWKYCRGVTNIVFIIFLLVVIYSQLTGVGISNYGLKKALPKLIIAAIMVNLSFLVCQILVDASNIIGDSLRGIFTSVEESVMNTYQYTSSEGARVSYAEIYGAMAGGATLTIGGSLIALESGAFWLLIPVVLGALVSVVAGLITIALRQAVVALLIMIAPLAFVSYILPNTEQWFKKWWGLLKRMLVFYPMFSLLFGASSLAGFAIIMSAQDGFGVILGTAVQIFPLFFSWKLMRMSGTFLEGINAKLRGLAAKPLATNKAWAESRRAQTRAYYAQYGRTPSARLQRFLDNRKTLRETNTKTLEAMRSNEANIYAQRKIGAGYDGSKVDDTEGDLTPNKYTRIAKDASNLNLASETATLDTKHVISEYGRYFVDKDVRKKADVAKKAKNKVELERLQRMNADYRRVTTGAANFLEFKRAQMTDENDSEADLRFFTNEYIDAAIKYDPEAKEGERDEEAYKKYRHYVLSSAGGLGDTGQARVLGKIIAQAAAVESNQRRDINILANKFPPDKTNFRNMLVGYHVDDDGYAVDLKGNRIEKVRGWLLENDPSKLVLWDKVDKNGAYFDWYDTNGKYVTRVYKSDGAAIKELMSNFDAPINDPINNLYGILAGVKPEKMAEINEKYKNIGLDKFRTTVGRALLSAPFKEKNAAFSPMVAEMIKKGYIQNYAQEHLAYLDSLNKATKPGAFNMQDGDAIDMMITMMDPDQWEEIFPTEMIRGYRNVNGEEIYGIRYDENGEKVKVPAKEATREELMERVKEKYIIPAAKKITVMMSRQTQNTMDNQKAGTVEKWKKLKEVLDTKWGEGKIINEDPYEQDGDMRRITKDIRDTLHTADENGNKRTTAGERNRRDERTGQTGNGSVSRNAGSHVNHAAQIYEIYNSSLDADDFAVAVCDYCASYPELAWVADQVQDYLVSAGYGVDKEQLYEFVDSLLAYVDYD